MCEIWKPLPNYPRYEVSNTGKIRSERGILKIRKDQHGYYQCQIVNDKGRKLMKVHRAVAMAFIPNPLNKTEVNHIDNDPTNNNLENLEWVTHKENMDWMHKQGRAKRTTEWIKNLNYGLDFMRKPVVGTNLKDGSKLFFDGVNKVKEKGFLPSSVSCCCRGIKYKSHRGYTWRYQDG